MRTLAAAFAAAVLSTTPCARAWGPIGHRMVAETAALLVERDSPTGWGRLIGRQRFDLGYYSIVPDTHFRYSDGHKGEVETLTHFFDIDLLGGEAKRILDVSAKSYSDARANLVPLIGEKQFLALGSDPWRIEQFLRLSRGVFSQVHEVKGGYQQGSTSAGDAAKIYRGLYYLGVMSHYSGDATMPYHATSDWNGWNTGQGGIHFFFESDCVNALEPGLSTDVLAEALKKRAAWLAGWNLKPAAGPAPFDDVPNLMLKIFAEDAEAVAPLAKIDREKVMTKPSDAAAKKFAERRPAGESCKYFRKTLIERLAKAAVLTASLWERVLPAGVDFSGGAALQFSDFDINPAFIPPDYISGKPADTELRQDHPR